MTDPRPVIVPNEAADSLRRRILAHRAAAAVAAMREDYQAELAQAEADLDAAWGEL